MVVLDSFWVFMVACGLASLFGGFWQDGWFLDLVVVCVFGFVCLCLVLVCMLV